MRKFVAIAAAAVISLGAFAPPALAAPSPTGAVTTSISSVSTSYVNYPQAVPGRYCKKIHRGDWTKTSRYGRVKCIDKNGWRWIRK